MNRILYLTIMSLFVTGSLLAQEFETNQDTLFQKREIIIVEDSDNSSSSDVITEVKGRVRSITKDHKSHSWDFGGIGLGYSGLVQNLGHLSMPKGGDFLSQKANSVNFNLYLFGYRYKVTDYFSIATRLEMEVNNFKWTENMSLRIENGMTVPDYSYDDRDINLEKSKLVTGYLNIPIMAKFNLGKFHVYGGVVGGWKFVTYNKIKADSPAMKGKYHYHDPLNIRNFHWGYTAGFGIKHIEIYAKYYPQSIFKTGHGPSAHQVNIGLATGF